jgi:predicted cobalt transporter CbtA
MLLADLLYGCGVATILAGVLVLVPGTRRAGARWLTATFAGAWGAVVVPAIAYPPLPPGVKSGLDIAVRQWLFLGCFALGAAGALAASVAWHRAGRRSRFLGAAAALAMPLAITIAVLPDQRVGRVPDKELLTHFRIVAVCAQLVFWIVLALAGTLLLRRADTDPAATAAE